MLNIVKWLHINLVIKLELAKNLKLLRVKFRQNCKQTMRQVMVIKKIKEETKNAT